MSATDAALVSCAGRSTRVVGIALDFRTSPAVVGLIQSGLRFGMSASASALRRTVWVSPQSQKSAETCPYFAGASFQVSITKRHTPSDSFRYITI